eukprot:gene31463-35520_t
MGRAWPAICSRNKASCWLWSRGEDLITDRFPELAALRLPEGTVVDGEILIWRGDGGTGAPALAPAPFAELQKRITRKSVSARMQGELPAVLVAYDLLEHAGQDMRQEPQQARRALLEATVEPTPSAATEQSLHPPEPFTLSLSKRRAGPRQAQPE